MGAGAEPQHRSFERRRTQTGVRRIRAHDTRHTCGSLLAAMDAHPRVAMQILRHNKIDTTWRSTRTCPRRRPGGRSSSWGPSLEDLEP